MDCLENRVRACSFALGVEWSSVDGFPVTALEIAGRGISTDAVAGEEAGPAGDLGFVNETSISAPGFADCGVGRRAPAAVALHRAPVVPAGSAGIAQPHDRTHRGIFQTPVAALARQGRAVSIAVDAVIPRLQLVSVTLMLVQSFRPEGSVTSTLNWAFDPSKKHEPPAYAVYR